MRRCPCRPMLRRPLVAKPPPAPFTDKDRHRHPGQNHSQLVRLSVKSRTNRGCCTSYVVQGVGALISSPQWIPGPPTWIEDDDKCASLPGTGARQDGGIRTPDTQHDTPPATSGRQAAGRSRAVLYAPHRAGGPLHEQPGPSGTDSEPENELNSRLAHNRAPHGHMAGQSRRSSLR